METGRGNTLQGLMLDFILRTLGSSGCFKQQGDVIQSVSPLPFWSLIETQSIAVVVMSWVLVICSSIHQLNIHGVPTMALC